MILPPEQRALLIANLKHAREDAIDRSRFTTNAEIVDLILAAIPDPPRGVDLSDAEVERLAEKLRDECRKIYNSTWPIDASHRFVRAILAELPKAQETAEQRLRAEGEFLCRFAAAERAAVLQDLAWATPEAKAALSILETPGLADRLHASQFFSLAQVIRAYLASLAPKTVTLPERYFIETADGTPVYTDTDRAAAERALALRPDWFLRVLPAETRPCQDPTT
jgi:hypothetical protein